MKPEQSKFSLIINTRSIKRVFFVDTQSIRTIYFQYVIVIPHTLEFLLQTTFPANLFLHSEHSKTKNSDHLKCNMHITFTALAEPKHGSSVIS